MSDVGILVLDANKRFLEYVHPAIARRLLRLGIATISSKEPFILKLNDKESSMVRSGSTTISRLAY